MVATRWSGGEGQDCDGTWLDQAPIRSLPARPRVTHRCSGLADRSTPRHEVGHNKGQATRSNDDDDPPSRRTTARGSSQKPHTPLVPIDWRTPWRSQSCPKDAALYWLPLSLWNTTPSTGPPRVATA